MKNILASRILVKETTVRTKITFDFSATVHKEIQKRETTSIRAGGHRAKR